MFAPGQNQLLANLSLLLFLRIFRSFVFMILKRTFEECVSLFSYQRSFFALPFVSNSFAIISCRFLPVKNFFSTFLKLFLFLSCSNFDILSHPTSCCQELFHFFLQLFVRRNSFMLSRVFSDVKNFFHFFPSTQKEGFEPSHGANRLYPQQGHLFSHLSTSARH